MSQGATYATRMSCYWIKWWLTSPRITSSTTLVTILWKSMVSGAFVYPSTKPFITTAFTGVFLSSIKLDFCMILIHFNMFGLQELCHWSWQPWNHHRWKQRSALHWQRFLQSGQWLRNDRSELDWVFWEIHSESFFSSFLHDFFVISLLFIIHLSFTILEPIQQRYLGGEVIFYLPLCPWNVLSVFVCVGCTLNTEYFTIEC